MHCHVWRQGDGLDLQKWFPKTLALETQESLLLECVLVVLKTHVHASLSSYPLCASLLCPLLGSPTPVELFPAEPLPTNDPAGRPLVIEDIALARQPLPRHLHDVFCPGPHCPKAGSQAEL